MFKPLCPAELQFIFLDSSVDPDQLDSDDQDPHHLQLCLKICA